MKKILSMAAVLVLMSTAAIAGPNSSGAYVGVGVGSSVYADDDFTKEVMLAGNLEDSDSGYTVYGGYQFNNVIGVELGYTDYGKFTADGDYSQSATSFHVAANAGYSFLDGQLRPFGTLGLGYVSLDWQNTPDYIASIDDAAGALHYGFGIQYEPDFLAGFGLRLAYEADIYAIQVTRIFGDDDTYSQVLGLMYIGAQYKF